MKYVLVTTVVVGGAYFFPTQLLFLVLCGVWDVSRNEGCDASVIHQYFLKNGIGTWLASPLNILMDILALPYINKGVYELEELPPDYQDEIRELLAEADKSNLIGRLNERSPILPRTMFFFKWYGRNAETTIHIPAFHKEYKFIRTIGVSAFRERERTSRHFGPFRPSLRVLYCLNEISDPNAYIKVGPVENRWRDNRLFIFDDTLLHQSFNDTDVPRYCLWADIIRPSYVPVFFNFAMNLMRLLFNGFNGIFYKNWKVINP